MVWVHRDLLRVPPCLLIYDTTDKLWYWTLTI